LDKKGENGYRLWREQITKDPQAQKYIPYLWAKNSMQTFLC
jgi:hypothetical protein